MSELNKYERAGAYHWQQADACWRNHQFNPLLVARYKTLLHFMSSPVGYVLDVGCGDGYLIHLMLAAGATRVFGVDKNWAGVSLA